MFYFTCNHGLIQTDNLSASAMIYVTMRHNFPDVFLFQSHKRSLLLVSCGISQALRLPPQRRMLRGRCCHVATVGRLRTHLVTEA